MADVTPSPNALPKLQEELSASGLRSAIVNIDVPAASVVPVEIAGKMFRVLYSDAALQIRYDSGPFIPHDVGTGQVLPAPMDQNGVPRQTYFKRLEIRNTSVLVLSHVILFVGTDDYVDSRLNLVRLAAGQYLPVMEGRSRIAAWNGVSILGGASLALAGAVAIDGGDPLNYVDIKRQSVVIANLDPASSLLIRDAAHTACGAVLPQTEQILPISEAIEVHNATGGAIACYIMEIWTCGKVII